MKKIYFSLILFFSFFSALFSQTVHDVSVANFQFTPASLEIDQGDMVRWTNAGGNHSVDGNAVDFPDNPEVFGNEIGSDMWVYEFTFDLIGEYNYKCGVHGGMLGSILVGNVSSTSNEDAKSISLYPNPVVDILQIQGLENFQGTMRIEVYDLSGKLVSEKALFSDSEIDFSEFADGIFFYSLFENGSVVQKGKILKEK